MTKSCVMQHFLTCLVRFKDMKEMIQNQKLISELSGFIMARNKAVIIIEK